MAKKEILYICEICGAKYQKEDMAEQCEKHHYKAVEIVSVIYDKNEQKKEFPLTINIKLKDGSGKERTITYSRK